MGLGDIEGKSFLVTGGASGLGAKYAEDFLNRGAKAVAILDISEEVGKATAARLDQAFPDKDVLFIKCDVSSEEDLVDAFNAVVDKFKQIDGLVNNAGLMNDSAKVWAKMCDVNYRGLVSLTSKAIEHMRIDKGGAGGTIVNVSSVAGFHKFRYLPVYAGLKTAVMQFSRCLAERPFFEKTGIRVLTIGFGPTDTPLLHNPDQLVFVSVSGKDFVEETQSLNIDYQKVESAVEAFMDMYTKAANGTIWVSAMDAPVKDLTQIFDRADDMITRAIYLE